MTALSTSASSLMARPTAVVTLGRLPKSIELVRALDAVGYRVVVAEPHAWHLCRVSRRVARCHTVTAPQQSAPAYVEALLRVVREEGATLVVPVSEETMHASALKALLPPSVEMYCPGQATLLALHDKKRFIDLALEAGVEVPLTVAHDDAQAHELLRAGPCVVKPRSSCSGRGVQFLERGQALPAFAEPSVVQARVLGDVVSTFSVAHRGEVLTTVVYRGVVMSGTVAVCFERIDVPAVDAWVKRFVAHHRHSGFISFDFVVEPSGRPLAIECNPRVTSGVHFIEPASLARAMLYREGPVPEVKLRPERLRQQFYPTLTETQKSVFDGARFRKNLAALTSARDVLWDVSDPLPFLTLPATAWRILSHSIRHRTSLGEASTFDIEWEEPLGKGPAA